jgi:hypothetical protein
MNPPETGNPAWQDFPYCLDQVNDPGELKPLFRLELNVISWSTTARKTVGKDGKNPEVDL